MPTYDFKCEACGHEFERMQGMNDANPPCPAPVPGTTETAATDTPVEAPRCGGTTRKLIRRGGTFHLKGGGWAKDGY